MLVVPCSRTEIRTMNAAITDGYMLQYMTSRDPMLVYSCGKECQVFYLLIAKMVTTRHCLLGHRKPFNSAVESQTCSAASGLESGASGSYSSPLRVDLNGYSRPGLAWDRGLSLSRSSPPYSSRIQKVMGSSLALITIAEVITKSDKAIS